MGHSRMRYEIKDITLLKHPPCNGTAKTTAEREKRAAILKSEGEKTSEINLAEAKARSCSSI